MPRTAKAHVAVDDAHVALCWVDPRLLQKGKVIHFEHGLEPSMKDADLKQTHTNPRETRTLAPRRR